jgi:hypothetical protein
MNERSSGGNLVLDKEEFSELAITKKSTFKSDHDVEEAGIEDKENRNTINEQEDRMESINDN